MRTYTCNCGNTLFFHSSRCLSCNARVGMCPGCNQVVSLTESPTGGLRCDAESCKHTLVQCENAIEHKFCNRLLETIDTDTTLCDYCQLTSVIPDQSVPENRRLWQRLELAKQRSLFSLENCGFDFRGKLTPKLSFSFKADGSHPITTGHANGVITINIREADSVARERTRVALGEPQRTLVGHFRHELGHYFWDQLVRDIHLTQFRTLFGNENVPSYTAAMQEYYDQGPPADWNCSYISAYASMHPWEDFAETFAAYQDMVSVVDTAKHFGVVHADLEEFDQLIDSYASVGVVANEFNRDIGLLDLVPEVLVGPVVEKLRFIHSLRSRGNSDRR